MALSCGRASTACFQCSRMMLVHHRVFRALASLLAAIQPGGLVFLDDAQIELVILDRQDHSSAARCGTVACCFHARDYCPWCSVP